jgi:RimJ/RimL family protein N-acetyltransferase
MDAVDRITPPPHPGQRLVVRHLLPDGSATDVTGWLEQLGAESLEVTDHQGRSVRIERRTVVAARRVPTARGGRDPRRTSAEELEQVTLSGWLADSEPLGEWTLRAAGGFTGRANSCLAVGDPGINISTAADRIVGFARSHGIAPLAQVVSGSAAETGLHGVGWRETYVPTDVLAARLGDLLGTSTPDPRVRVSDEPTPEWTSAYQRSRPDDADPEVLRRILAGRPPTGLASAGGHGGLVAIGRGHVAAGWLGLAALWTEPEHRRRGWATAVVLALGHWGARSGARQVYLQVAQQNEPAHRAYERLGFRLHHSYRYLAPAGERGADEAAAPS